LSDYNCIVVLGPTASGKTRLACVLAHELNGEIISADSRQVYKGLNIGTGKDYEEYKAFGEAIKYHLIDICEPGETFFLHDFMRECKKAFGEIISEKKLPLICGGTGLYLDSLRKDFSLTQIPEDHALRGTLQVLSKEELLGKLKQHDKKLTHHADTSSVKRIIRAIEVAKFLSENPDYLKPEEKPYKPFYIGIKVNIDERKSLIAKRLDERLQHGLIGEVEELLKSGITYERLEFFGLEYKFVSWYLQNKISRQELRDQLFTAICQFSKRQMTWFRKMEKEGVKILWIERHADPAKLLADLKKIF
jgi:tRNA dimethylallyltransferase